MDELKTFIAGCPYPIFIVDSNTRHIHYANNISKAQTDEDPAGTALDSFVGIIHHPVSGKAYTQFGEKWYQVRQKDIGSKDQPYFLIELIERDDVPNEKDLESWKRMIAVMLHRLRSPLTGINGYLDMMEDENQDKNLEKRFISINKGLTHVYDLMDELELLYNIPSKTDKDDFNEFNPHELVQQHISTLDKSQQKRVALAAEGHDFHIHSLPLIVRKIITLLLANALEHSDDQHIDISLSAADGGSITIKNTTDGIPSDVREHIFYPFVTTKANNLGIGLTMALLYARQIGGTLFLEEDKEDGTVICQLKFPLKDSI